MANPDLEEEDARMDTGPSQEQQDASQEQGGDEEMDLELDAALEEAMQGWEGTQQEQEPGLQLTPQYEQPSQEQLTQLSQERTHKRRLSDDMPTGSRPSSRAEQVEEVRQAEAARKRAVFEAMTEDQRNRYEAYCRAAVPRKKVKKLLQALQGHNAVNEKVLIAISSITKMFLGEIVERARILASQQGHEGALLPSQLRQAYAELQQERKVPHRGPPRPMLR